MTLSLVTASLIAGLALGLPALGALPPDVPPTPPLWAFLAPLLAGGTCAALALVGHAALRRSARPSRLANLPAHVILTYSSVTVVGVVAGALLEPSALYDHRPVLVLTAGPALVVAHAVVLRSVILGPLTRDLVRVAAGRADREQASDDPGPAAPGAPASGPGVPALDTPRRPKRVTAALSDDPERQARLAGVGVLSIRSSTPLVAMTAVITALLTIAGHAYSLAQHQHEQRSARHLQDMLAVVSAQARYLPPYQLQRFLRDYPVSTRGMPLLLDAAGRARTSAGAIEVGTQLTPAQRTCSTDDERVFRCALGPVHDGLRLAVVQPLGGGAAPPALRGLGRSLALLSLGFLLLAVLLGRAVGNDISRDFAVMANQLRAMARQDEPDLGLPVSVTSIDEVGDLTERIGRLRTRLEHELEGQRESLRQAREADRIKNAFFSTVNQELRTPLTTLSGHAQLLLEQRHDPLSESQAQDIRSIHHGGEQLLSLINDVIDISMVETGHLVLAPELVDAGALVRELVAAQRAALAASPVDADKLSLQCEVAPDLPRIEVDPRRLRQVVQNLLGNAIKFTPEGTISVHVSPTEDGISLRVRDTGVGIGANDLPRVFESFRQVGELQLRRQGSGLGLAITRHLVELHGGTIEVDSAPGEGSTFTVSLPRRVPGPRREAAA